MLAMFRRGLFYSYLSIYLREFLGLSVTGSTLFATFPMLLNILFQSFVWGPISDRFQRRRTLIILGETLAGAGTVAVWYAHILPASRVAAGYVIIFGLSIIEIFWSMSNIGWSALISDIYQQEQRNAIQGKLISVGAIGRIGGVWIGGLLYDGMGRYYPGWGFYHGTLFFIATAVMFASVLPLLNLPEGGILREPAAGSKVSPIPVKPQDRIFFFFLAAMTLINFGRNAIAVILPQYMVLGTGFAVSSQVVGRIVNTQSVAMILMGLAAGSIAKRLGDGLSLAAGTMLAVVSLVLLVMARHLGLLYLSNFIRGCSEVMVTASSYAFASRLIPPQRRARLFSLFNATFFLSWGVAATLMAGPIIDLLIAKGVAQTTAYRVAFAAAAAMTLVGLGMLGILLGWILPRAQKEKSEPYPIPNRP